jgi:hypothetical protein
MKNAIFWDVTLCDSCKNRRFGGTCRLHHQGDKNLRAGILVTMVMEAIRSSETPVLTRAMRRHISEDCILH